MCQMVQEYLSVHNREPLSLHAEMLRRQKSVSTPNLAPVFSPPTSPNISKVLLGKNIDARNDVFAHKIYVIGPASRTWACSAPFPKPRPRNQ